MYDAFPWLMHHFPGPHQEVFAFNDFMHNLVMNEVQTHEREKAGDPQDLIDFYLAQIEKVSICLPHKPLLGLGAYYKYCLLSNYYRILICTLCLARNFFALMGCSPFSSIKTNCYMTRGKSENLHSLLVNIFYRPKMTPPQRLIKTTWFRPWLIFCWEGQKQQVPLFSGHCSIW